MAELNISKKLIKLTKACVEVSTSAIRIEGKVFGFFTITKDLEQGDALSPLLLNIALEAIIRKINTETSFADDIAIVEIRPSINVKEEFIKLDNAAKLVGLTINKDKTKYMVTTRMERIDRIGKNVTIDRYNFERVHQFKYLGAIITSDIDITQEINNRNRVETAAGLDYKK